MRATIGHIVPKHYRRTYPRNALFPCPASAANGNIWPMPPPGYTQKYSKLFIHFWPCFCSIFSIAALTFSFDAYPR
jgi:hypothetical protein